VSVGFLRPRTAFTLVELLVVIAIIGALVALLMPAVQMARESARRVSCTNNMRQIGRGLEYFHDTNGVLPPGAISSSASKQVRAKFSIKGQTEHGWGQFLLPFIEQKILYDQYHWDADWRAPENKLVRETHLQVFTCASAPNGKQGKRKDSFKSGGFDWQAAAADYSITNGLDYKRLRPLKLLDDYGLPVNDKNKLTFGVMRENEFVRFAEIKDGLSNTTWITEDAGRPALYKSGGRLDPSSSTGGAGWADPMNWSTLHGYNAATDRFNGPCPINCTNRAEIFSFHPGGAMIVMGDGSTHFLSEATDIRLVARLITRKARDNRLEN
jgi:prepilin-type N-terminal cleavage/methylation domain-containing protein